MRILALVLVLIFSAPPMHAREVAGIELPDAIQLETGGDELLLNGAGVRKKLFFSVYLGSLYLPAKSSDPAVILNTDQANRVQMNIIHSEVERKKLVSAWNDGFSANHSEQELALLQERIDTFNGMFDTLVAGDRVELDYLPGSGTRVRINGNQRGVIEGYDFNQAILKIWLGESPVTKKLKRDLLGE